MVPVAAGFSTRESAQAADVQNVFLDDLNSPGSLSADVLRDATTSKASVQVEFPIDLPPFVGADEPFAQIADRMQAVWRSLSSRCERVPRSARPTEPSSCKGLWLRARQ